MEQSIRLERRFAIIDEWLLDLDISDRAIRLYAVLARYADSETHKAYPSRGTLAERLRCSKASVDRASQELVDAGAMTKKQRHNSSVIYTLQVSSPLNRGVLTGDEGGSAPVMRGVLTGDDLTITTELEPVEPKPLNNIDSHFDTFWAEYPRKQGKGKAREAFRTAVKNAGVDAVIAGAVRYASDPNLPDPQFIPLPTTWLNQERWDDGPLPLNRKMTNSERNVKNFRASLALLSEQPMKEVENEQGRNSGAIDFGVNFRSADSV
jgi:hypothetical protein